jgi:glucose/arabinose dehydrogenase
MHLRLLQAGLLLAIAGCNSAPSEAVAPAKAESFAVTPLATFDSPWAMAFLPDGSALVTEKAGQLKHWQPGKPTTDVVGAPKVAEVNQGGLLDVVLSPHFASDRQVYLTYSEPSNAGGSALALSRATLVSDASGMRLDNPQVIWRDPEGGKGGQFGAIVAFAPDGQSLFLTSGERQRFTPAQDPNQPLGKILHLTLDGKPVPGNPMAGKTGASTVTVTDPPEDTVAAKTAPGRTFTWPGPNLTPSETWSSGHRNPYGLAFAPDGRLWETEMGPQGGDELNVILPGRNYGWPVVSNGDNYDDVPIPDHKTRPEFEAPRLWWNPSVAPTSLLIYTGDLFPGWKGNGFIGTLAGQSLMRVTIEGDNAKKAQQWDMGARIRFVGQGPDGAIYLLEDGDGGRLLRLAPKG